MGFYLRMVLILSAILCCPSAILRGTEQSVH